MWFNFNVWSRIKRKNRKSKKSPKRGLIKVSQKIHRKSRASRNWRKNRKKNRKSKKSRKKIRIKIWKRNRLLKLRKRTKSQRAVTDPSRGIRTSPTEKFAVPYLNHCHLFTKIKFNTTHWKASGHKTPYLSITFWSEMYGLPGTWTLSTDILFHWLLPALLGSRIPDYYMRKRFCSFTYQYSLVLFIISRLDFL